MADNKEALPVVVRMRAPHKVWCAQLDPTPGPCDCGAALIQLTDHATATAALSELRAEVERLRSVVTEATAFIELKCDWTSHGNVYSARRIYPDLFSRLDTARSAASGESAEGGV